MDTNNHAADAPKDEENFAEMFEKSLKKQGKLEPGQMVEAAIVKISPEWVFLDLGGKGEGYLDKKELLDENGAVSVREGDTIRAYFVSSQNNEMHFTTKIGSGPGKQSQIEDAYRNRIPVEGTLVREMKGGFEVRIGGSIRAFCPFSQTGFRRDENQAGYMGKSLSFMIIEYGENGRNIVLSRRPILDEEKRTKKEELKAKLTEGLKIRGKVTSIQSFGAFVDIGGIEGLLPISEISYSRTEKVGDILTKGQDVEVIIKKLDWDANRFSFSLKDTLPDPWEAVIEAYPIGSYHPGTVSRLAPFGAFVTLKEGIDGLIHISKLGAGKRINHPREIVKEGQAVEVKIEAVDRAARKLSLSLAEVSRAADEEAQTVKDYKQQSGDDQQTMGSLGDLLKAKIDQKKN
jgi:small subunit ribosomal protein S1